MRIFQRAFAMDIMIWHSQVFHSHKFGMFLSPPQAAACRPELLTFEIHLPQPDLKVSQVSALHHALTNARNDLMIFAEAWSLEHRPVSATDPRFMVGRTVPMNP